MSKHKTNADFNKALPAETAKEFKVVGLVKRTSFKITWGLYGSVDFSKLSIARAKQLVKQGFPYLEKQKKSGKTESKEATS